MKKQLWIFTVKYYERNDDARTGLGEFRRAVVGPAEAATVEAALRLHPRMQAEARAEILAHQEVHRFIEGQVDHSGYGSYVDPPLTPDHHTDIILGKAEEKGFSWWVGFAVHEVLGG